MSSVKPSPLLSSSDIRRQLGIPTGSFPLLCARLGITPKEHRVIRGRWTGFYTQADVAKIKEARKS